MKYNSKKIAKRKNNPGVSNKISAYFSNHLQAAIISFMRLIRAPIATFLTLMVIGITLAFPALFYSLLQNVRNINIGWQGNTRISMYLKMNIADNQVQDLLNQLQANAQIAAVKYISPAKGLKQFENTSGFKSALAELQQNPLPGVIEIQPILSLKNPASLESLVASLQQLPEVDTVKLDMAWVQRLYEIVKLGDRGVFALMLLLGIGVLLVIGNTIRLAIQSDKKEITVLKLVGATDAFVRRPFLYTGIYYGFLGGLVAWILVGVIFAYLQAPVKELADSYDSNYVLHSLSAHLVFGLLVISMVLGWLGARFAVNKHLKLENS